MNAATVGPLVDESRAAIAKLEDTRTTARGCVLVAVLAAFGVEGRVAAAERLDHDAARLIR